MMVRYRDSADFANNAPENHQESSVFYLLDNLCILVTGWHPYLLL